MAPTSHSRCVDLQSMASRKFSESSESETRESSAPILWFNGPAAVVLAVLDRVLALHLEGVVVLLDDIHELLFCRARGRLRLWSRR